MKAAPNKTVAARLVKQRLPHPDVEKSAENNRLFLIAQNFFTSLQCLCLDYVVRATLRNKTNL